MKLKKKLMMMKLSFCLAVTIGHSSSLQAEDVFPSITSQYSFAPKGEFKKKKLYFGALGDSITRGINAAHWGGNRSKSWSTGGRKVNSVRRRLGKLVKRVFGKKIRRGNFAKSGSKVKDLQRQLKNLLPNQPDFITILTGANDVCTWKPNHEIQLNNFENNLRKAMDTIVEQRPNAHVVLSSLPDMRNLFEVSHETKKCRKRWNFLKFCKPLLKKDRTEEEREAFYDRLADLNDAIARVANDYGDNLYYAENVQYLEFEKKDVSKIDCFHPSTKGQKKLSEAIWEGGWKDKLQDSFSH